MAFKVLFCGICHSDLHLIRNEWGNSIYPIVPGHEIAGEVTEVGSKVENFKVGTKWELDAWLDRAAPVKTAPTILRTTAHK